MRATSSMRSASRVTSLRRKCGTVTSRPSSPSATREAEARAGSRPGARARSRAPSSPSTLRVAQADRRAGRRRRRRRRSCPGTRRAPRQLDHQPRGDDLRLHRLLGREALLEARGRLAAQPEPLRGAVDVRAVPGRDLHQHARRVVVDLGARAAHDAGDRRRPVGVVDDAASRRRACAPASSSVVDLLAVARAAHDEPPAGDAVEVEGVQRLAGRAASRSW